MRRLSPIRNRVARRVEVGRQPKWTHRSGEKRMKRLSSSQVPGVYRRNVGNVAVATVNDGMIPTAFDHIVGADPAACEATHRSAGRPTPPWLTVNTYLIESGEHLMLVDAGFADTSPGPALGGSLLVWRGGGP